MTLENLKEFWRNISLLQKDVLTFNVGSNYDSATNTDDKYPLVFWEMPYTINYNAEFSKRLDTVTCSMSVFLYTKQDDIKDCHEALSFAKTIGDAIITKARMTATEFTIQSVNAVSVREYSDDSVAGIRYDIVMLLQRDVCEAEISTYFNE